MYFTPVILTSVKMVCVCECVSVCPSVCPPVFSLTAATLSVKRGHNYYQVGGMNGKLRFWNGEGRGSW